MQQKSMYFLVKDPTRRVVVCHSAVPLNARHTQRAGGREGMRRERTRDDRNESISIEGATLEERASCRANVTDLDQKCSLHL